MIKDYLEYEAIVLVKITPSTVLKSAVEAKVINNGDVWIEALHAHNKMAHVYNFSQFEIAIAEIQKKYLTIFDDLHLTMLENTFNSA